MGKPRVPYSGLIFNEIKNLKPGSIVTVSAVLKGNKSKFSAASVSSFFSKLAKDGALKKTDRQGVYEVSQTLESYDKRHPFRSKYTPSRRPTGPRKRTSRHALPTQPVFNGAEDSIKIIDSLLNVMAAAEPVLMHIKEDLHEMQQLRSANAAYAKLIGQYKDKLAKVKDIL